MVKIAYMRAKYKNPLFKVHTEGVGLILGELPVAVARGTSVIVHTIRAEAANIEPVRCFVTRTRGTAFDFFELEQSTQANRGAGTSVIHRETGKGLLPGV